MVYFKRFFLLFIIFFIIINNSCLAANTVHDPDNLVVPFTMSSVQLYATDSNFTGGLVCTDKYLAYDTPVDIFLAQLSSDTIYRVYNVPDDTVVGLAPFIPTAPHQTAYLSPVSHLTSNTYIRGYDGMIWTNNVGLYFYAVDSSVEELQNINANIIDLQESFDTYMQDFEEFSNNFNEYSNNFNNFYQDFRDYFFGNTTEFTDFSENSKVIISGSNFNNYGFASYHFNFRNNYFYKITVTYNTHSISQVPYFWSSINYNNNDITTETTSYLGSLSPDNQVTFYLSPNDLSKEYLYLGYGGTIASVTCEESINSLTSNLENGFNQVDTSINETKDYLQENPEDNTTIESGLVQDDTQDITEAGVDSIFTSVYNAFCNSSVQNITIKCFDWSATLSSDMFTSYVPSPIRTFISSAWYFSICWYIYKDIAKTIEKVKDGNFTDTDNNIKLEVL